MAQREKLHRKMKVSDAFLELTGTLLLNNSTTSDFNLCFYSISFSPAIIHLTLQRRRNGASRRTRCIGNACAPSSS